MSVNGMYLLGMRKLRVFKPWFLLMYRFTSCLTSRLLLNLAFSLRLVKEETHLLNT
jgi:hypothetical protein